MASPRFQDGRSMFPSPTESDASHASTFSSASNSPTQPLVRQSHRAAFLERNDPSLRDHGAVDDAIRMRSGQAEFVSARCLLIPHGIITSLRSFCCGAGLLNLRTDLLGRSPVFADLMLLPNPPVATRNIDNHV